VEDIIKTEFLGKEFFFTPTFQANDLIGEVFADNYGVFSNKVEFAEGDIVLDVGSCEGMFSILMAKMFPMVRVISFEPIPRTYYTMVRNIGLNGCMNIEHHNVGLWKESGKLPMLYGIKGDAGGSSAVMTYNPEWHLKVNADVITLDEAFDRYHIPRVRLLKIDTEGAEYDILYNGDTSLSKVDYIVGEFHINSRLDFDGRRIDGLINWLNNRTKVLHATPCRMAE
jgi:FkbM family methyltransferase